MTRSSSTYRGAAASQPAITQMANATNSETSGSDPLLVPPCSTPKSQRAGAGEDVPARLHEGRELGCHGGAAGPQPDQGQ